MKKYLIGLTLSLFIIPSITFASWWNPLSWFNSKKTYTSKDAEKKLLENRITELEQRINELTQSPQPTITPTVSATTTTSVPPKIIEAKPIQKAKSTIIPENNQPKILNSIQKTNNTDYKKIFDEILGKYLTFLSTLKLERLNAERLIQPINVRDGYIAYIETLNQKVNLDIQVLSKTRSPNSDILIYNNKYQELVKELSENRVYYNRIAIIQLIKNNRSQIDKSATHAEVATHFATYDKLSNTNYAPKFRATSTTQQGIEFIDSFLMDVGYF